MTLVEHVKNLVLKGNWWRTLMKGLKLKAKSYTSALSVFENFVSIKRTQPSRIKNLNCLSSLLVVLAVIFADFYVQRLTLVVVFSVLSPFWILLY